MTPQTPPEVVARLKELSEGATSEKPVTVLIEPDGEHAWLQEPDGCFLNSPLGMNPSDALLYAEFRSNDAAILADLAALAEARKAAEWARLMARAMKARFPFDGLVCREIFETPRDADGLPVHTPELEAVLRAAIRKSQ